MYDPNSIDILFRIYDDGEIVHEKDFKYKNLGIIKDLNYTSYRVPRLLVDYLES